LVSSATVADDTKGGTMKLVDRVGALSGAAGVVLVIVGSDVLGTPPGPQVAHPTGQQDLANLQWVANHSSAQVGVSLELLGFTMSMIFIGYLVTRFRDAGWLALAALVGGVVEVAIKLGSGAPVFAAYLLRDDISPETARALIDMNAAAFVTTWLPMGVFVACAAAAGLVTGDLGRVLGWGGVTVGIASVVVTAATGVHMLSAIFVPFLLCVLWKLLVSLRLGLARTDRLGAHKPAVDLDAMPSPV
jgi:hypothetical protein